MAYKTSRRWRRSGDNSAGLRSRHIFIVINKQIIHVAHAQSVFKIKKKKMTIFVQVEKKNYFYGILITVITSARVSILPRNWFALLSL